MDPLKKKTDFNSLPTRQYLDQTVNPILLPALKGNEILYLKSALLKFTNNKSLQLLRRNARQIQSRS
jgi:hypothetical protein